MTATQVPAPPLDEKKQEDRKLDKELKESFPTSDTPASVQPGSGITGAEKRPGDPPRH